jgi:nitroreductase
MLRELIIKNRSYRRFEQKETIDETTLRELVDLARLSASAANLQPLRYILSCEKLKNELIFPHLAWAGYLKDWPGPADGERPSAYIVILADTKISVSAGIDCGIAAQSILLGASEKGLGGCMIGSIQKDGIRDALSIPAQYQILLVIALGVPKERAVIKDAGPDGDIKYWRDSEGIHYVPKRSLDDLILG